MGLMGLMVMLLRIGGLENGIYAKKTRGREEGIGFSFLTGDI